MHARRILITETMPATGFEMLRSRADVHLDVLAIQSVAAMKAGLAAADAVIVVGERPSMTADLIAAAPRLRVAARMGAGTDNVDIEALTARAIPLLTTGGTNATAVAEHALYLLLAIAKRGPMRDRAVKAGQWPRAFGAVELAGKTCLIVGLGRIGRAIARRVKALEMTVVGVDPHLTHEVAAELEIGLAPSLESALPQADAIILACAMNEATRGMINSRRLALAKPGAFLVNVARGGVVDEAALGDALADGRLGGAGLDVLTTEPPRGDHPLLRRDDVVLTPHTGSQIAETYERMSAVCARAVLEALDGRVDETLVANPMVLAPRSSAKP